MTINSKLDLELSQLRRVAPAGYYMGLHIRFASPLVTLQSYREDWIEYYTEKGYLLYDPSIRWGMVESGTRRWSDFADSDPRGVVAEAAQFGLRFGVSCSWGAVSGRSIGSFARSDREFTDREVELVFELFQRVHELTLPPDELTQPQIDALRCIGNGDRHAAAAQKLGISESALKARIAGARQRLGARTTAEAIQRAKDYGLI
ncbi:autoinducer binding domain-containing protein [Cereibacter azotoformans]|uniref:LuxR family transcriptional regulator n=2 Tax=Cereibacter TaxID=1653176 RepID=A0A2T5K7G4_9RHOB|nr:autoinducer binding domain-containing protein [Cereibacter azotoformans]AXQ94378.1 LuxR family transcriptional regulator [Cereibacter sphaeroides]MBO4167802.1 autoinducer binding domain-containing protein [Cereibacter azotoformans]PTR18363.1 LuxR family transcriptional regulator [Cereibacter azotoformans]UIJ29921.1 autoinducer binding domain-containing protein [Cereibacter azotoformans]ULB10616.1 autoinducer binding domain-containing protein [Cereibacter azotoformans]